MNCRKIEIQPLSTLCLGRPEFLGHGIYMGKCGKKVEKVRKINKL